MGKEPITGTDLKKVTKEFEVTISMLTIVPGRWNNSFTIENQEYIGSSGNVETMQNMSRNFRIYVLVR